MIIRNANESDAPSLKGLLVQLGYPALNEKEILDKIVLHSTGEYALLVAEMDAGVVGFISLHWFEMFHSTGKIGRISAFCVDEGIRGKGIGLQLLEEAENLLKINGCAKIEVTSNERRTLTHQFYLNRGYTQESRRFAKPL